MVFCYSNSSRLRNPTIHVDIYRFIKPLLMTAYDAIITKFMGKNYTDRHLNSY